MKINIKDRILLLATGLSVFAFGIPIYIFLDNRFSEEWAMFVIMSLGYLITLIYLPFTSARLRQLSKVRLILFQFIMFIITVGIAAIIFGLRLLPMPPVPIYSMAIVILAAMTMVFLEYCIKKWNFLK